MNVASRELPIVGGTTDGTIVARRLKRIRLTSNSWNRSLFSIFQLSNMKLYKSIFNYVTFQRTM